MHAARTLRENGDDLFNITFRLQTSENLRITLKGSLRVSNEWSLEGAMYILKPTCMENFSGGGGGGGCQKSIFMQISENIYAFSWQNSNW